MTSCEHILISLEKRHAENILCGRKHIELRRRRMIVADGTTVWIYVKAPIGGIVGCVQVSGSHTLAPTTLWKRFAAISGLTRKEFFAYFSGVSKGFALALRDPKRCRCVVSLADLRAAVDGFHPPQFFLRLTENSPLLRVIAQ